MRQDRVSEEADEFLWFVGSWHRGKTFVMLDEGTFLGYGVR